MMTDKTVTGGARLQHAAVSASWAALAFASLAVPVTEAKAQAAPAAAGETATQIDISAQPLGSALRRFAEITGVQLGYSTELVADKQSTAITGIMTPREALAQLLRGTSLTAKLSGRNATIQPAEVTADGEKLTGAVKVEGAQGSPYFGGAGVAAGVNGTNGSRDITATEGTGSFTSGALTIGSKVPQALKDVPQSLSMLTSERLDQQNITDFTTAMKQLPGITLTQGATSLESTFYSRGFAITNIQVDGGAPLATGPLTYLPSFGYNPQIDMSEYDHVELLRGAAGAFNGFGDPSGTVNLVRKKPLDHQQFTLEGVAGSWNNYRVVADATSPLALGGRLRGRLVLTYQHNHYFYNTAEDAKTLIYGIAEFDATPTTLLTAGISYTRQDSVPWRGGLPRFQNGDDLKLPRSECLCFSWNRWGFDTTEIFGSVEQKIGSNWTAKINLTDNRQTNIQKSGYVSGAVNPLTGAGSAFNATYRAYETEQFSAEGTLTGAFEIFGQRQEVAFGINRTTTGNGAGFSSVTNLLSGSPASPYQPYPNGPTFYRGSPNGTTPPVNVFAFSPSDPLYNEPSTSFLPGLRYNDYGQAQSNAYFNLRLTAFDRLHLTTAFHWSQYENHYTSVLLCTVIPTTGTPAADNCVGRKIGDVYGSPTHQAYHGSNLSWPPAVSLSFDVTKQLTAYVGYTDIYQTQASELDANLKPIGPITGSNIEGGAKWAARNGRLNVSVAAYRIRQKGFATEDGTADYNVTPQDTAAGITYYWVTSGGNRIANNSFDNVSHYCCFTSDPNRTLKSDGFDVEATGELMVGWQVSASFTYDRTKQDGSYFGTNAGLPTVSLQPKNLYKLWTSYDFGASGKKWWLSGLTLSGGINGQSSGFQSGTACLNLNPPNALGVSTCKSSRAPDTVPYSFVVPAYALVSGRIDYRFSKIWSLAVNLENIFDKTYYQTTGSVTGGNWYGPPRSVAFSLRGKW